VYRRAWFDSDVTLKVEISTSGALIGDDETQTAPFLAGGVNGYPLYWQQTDTSQNARFTVTTDSTLNRWSFSNVAAQGIYSGVATIAYVVQAFDFANYDYVIQWQVRTMEGKDKARQMCYAQETINGAQVGSDYALSTADTTTDWTTYATAWTVKNAGANGIRLRFGITGPLTGATDNWGGQFSNLVFIKRPKVVPAIDWRDISCDIREINTRYGRERYTNRFDVATASVVVNNIDGEYTYKNPHPFNLRPGRKIRISANYAGIDYPQFYGVIDTLMDGYAIDGAAITTIHALDPTYVLSNMNTPARALPTSPPTKSGARILALLGLVGWRDYLIDVGQWDILDIAASSRSVRDEMGVTSDSEGGQLYADRSGRIVYKDRTWPTTDPNLKSATATLLARPSLEESLKPDPIPDVPGAPTLCVNELRTSWSQDRTINHVELANAGYSVVKYDDFQSQKDNGIFTYQRLDFVLLDPNNSKGYLAQRASDIMRGYAQPVLRVDVVSFRPGANDHAWKWTLEVFLNWLVRVWYANVRELWGFSVVTHVQSVEHRITINDWEVTLAIDLPEYFADAPILDSFYWDDPLTLWDSATWQV